MPVEREPTDALIAIGSNIEPGTNIAAALAMLRDELSITAVSNFYWSDPVGDPGQPRFLNGACRIRTGHSPRELKFSVLRKIEDDLGRDRTRDKYAPRTIDLDIAIYGNTIVDEGGLHIPDPDIVHRAFLAVPLSEIAPDWVLPRAGVTLHVVAAGLSRSGLIPEPGMTALARQIVDEEFPR